MSSLKIGVNFFCTLEISFVFVFFLQEAGKVNNLWFLKWKGDQQ